GVVVQHGCATEACTERVEYVFERHLLIETSGAAGEEILEPTGRHFLIVALPPEGVRIRNQRVQPVNGDKFLGNGIRGAKVLLGRPWNAGQQILMQRASERLDVILTQRAPPAATHAVLERRILQ